MAQVRPMIRNLAQYLQQLAEETQNHINQFNRKLDSTNEVVSALVRVLGQDVVENALKEAREEKQKAFEDAQDAATAKLLEQGGLTAVDSVGEDCLVVGTDTYKDGVVRRVRFEMASLSTEQKAKFLAKKVGDEESANEVTFKITEIYKINQEVIAKLSRPTEVPVDTEPKPEAAPAPKKKSRKGR